MPGDKQVYGTHQQ